MLEKASLHALAASYAHGSNKRTSLVIAETSLNLNGMELTASDNAVVIIWLKLAADAISEISLEQWITENSRQMSTAK